MIINTYTIPPYQFKNKLLNSIFKDCVYLDIETTGLSSKFDTIIAITLLTMDDEAINLSQIFIESVDTENEALIKFMDLIKTKKYLITYNGNSFDIPFISYKLNKYNINNNIDSYYKIDLYKDVRLLSSKIDLENMKLKTIESYFGIQRDDALSGKDIVTLYKSYQINNKQEHMELILLHNYEDVYYLPIIFDNILDLYDKCIYHNIDDKFIFAKLLNKNIIANKNQIRINFDLISSMNMSYSGHGSYYEISYISESNISNIRLYADIYKDNAANELLYINNTDINLESYTSIKNLRQGIVPLKLNNNLFYNNIYAIIEKIIREII